MENHCGTEHLPHYKHFSADIFFKCKELTFLTLDKKKNVAACFFKIKVIYILYMWQVNT